MNAMTTGETLSIELTYRDYYNQLNADVSVLENRRFEIHEAVRDFRTGLFGEGLVETRESLVQQIEKCQQTFAAFVNSISPYERDSETLLIANITNRYEAITEELINLNNQFDLSPAEARLNNQFDLSSEEARTIAQQSSRRRMCCVAVIVVGIVVGVLIVAVAPFVIAVVSQSR